MSVVCCVPKVHWLSTWSVCRLWDSTSQERNDTLTAQLSISPARIRFAPLQPKFSRRMLASGAKANVPNPEPQTAIPVAKDLFVSK